MGQGGGNSRRSASSGSVSLRSEPEKVSNGPDVSRYDPALEPRPKGSRCGPLAYVSVLTRATPALRPDRAVQEDGVLPEQPIQGHHRHHCAEDRQHPQNETVGAVMAFSLEHRVPPFRFDTVHTERIAGLLLWIPRNRDLVRANRIGI